MASAVWKAPLPEDGTLAGWWLRGACVDALGVGLVVDGRADGEVGVVLAPEWSGGGVVLDMPSSRAAAEAPLLPWVQAV